MDDFKWNQRCSDKPLCCEADKRKLFNMLAEEMRVEDFIGTAKKNMKTGIKEGSELDYSIDDIMARTKLSKNEINQIISARYH